MNCRGFNDAQRIPPDSPEITELLEYLSEFDIIMDTANLGQFMAESEKRAGWTPVSQAGGNTRYHTLKSSLPYSVTSEMRQYTVDHIQVDLQLWNRAHELGLFTESES